MYVKFKIRGSKNIFVYLFNTVSATPFMMPICMYNDFKNRDILKGRLPKILNNFFGIVLTLRRHWPGKKPKMIFLEDSPIYIE